MDPLGAALTASAACLALGVTWALERRTGPWAPGRRALRLLLAAACAAAAAAPTLDLGSARTRALILDLSRSVERARPEVLAAAREAWADLDPAGDRVALVLFGRDVVVVPPLPPRDAGAALEAALKRPPDPRGSDVGRALRAALDQVGQDAQALLISDGRDTGGRALLAAADLAARGVVLHAWSPGAPPLRGARLARLDAPSRAPAGGAPVPVHLEARAARPTEVTLTLEAGPLDGPAEVVGSARGSVGPGQPLRALLLAPPPSAGEAVRLRARVDAAGADDAPEDDALEAVVAAGAGRRALVIEGAPGAGAPLARVLGEVATVDVVDPATAGAALDDPAPLDLIVVVDAPAAALEPLVPALERTVASGSTLVLAGARRAFGPGRWADAAVERLSPVTSGPGDERERPLCVAVALDASGSMAAPLPGGGTRYEQAVDAVAASLDEARGPLRPGDVLAVLAFAERPTVVREPGPLREGDVRALREDLGSRRHAPGGGTDIGAALARALEALARAPADADRVLLLVSDAGDRRPGGPDVEAVRRAVEALPEPGRLSALAALVDVTPDEAASVRALLEPLEAAGADVRPPQVITDAGAPLRELIDEELLLRTSARREGAFAVRLTEAGRARGLSPPATVDAYAPTRARAEATTLAVVDDPELEGRPPPAVASWRRGLGRVVAAPVEAPVAAAALASLGEDLLPAARHDAAVAVRRVGDELEVELVGRDLPPRLTVHVAGDEGARATSPLVAATPTTARGWVPAPSARALVVTVTTPDGAPLARATVPDAAHDEVAGEGVDHAQLAALTAATGGRVLGTLPPPPPPSSRAPWPLAPALALAALIALVAEAGLATWQARRRAVTAPGPGR